MPRNLQLLSCCLLGLTATLASAQEYSYDGNRWYEIEISIFTNEVPGGTRSEVPVAHKLTAAYLPRLRELQARSSTFLIDFPADRSSPVLPAMPPPAPEVPLVTMGPIYSPAVREGFRIADFARDPFVDLDARAAQFTSMNRSIEGAPEHRLLWHKVWRQPMQGRAQTAAVFVDGGERRDGHSELEGSLRLVDNAGGAMLDLNVWLNEFRPGTTIAEATEWTIPAQPFPLEEGSVAPDALPWQLTAVWQLAQTRELSGNQLYYLDHPAIGVLIQARPYVLPPRLIGDDQDDF